MVSLRKFSSVFFLLLPAMAGMADESGDFDYYILALSWNAGWCEIEGFQKNAPQCDEESSQSGFSLHGLWPQYETGWPEYCRTSHPNPSKRETAARADLFGSSGAAWHQWNKHGRCSDMGHQEYYDQAERLFERYETPEILLKIEEPMIVDGDVIEAVMIENYPDLEDEGMAVICRKGLWQELRICLNRDFEPMHCQGDAGRDCEYAPRVMPGF